MCQSCIAEGKLLPNQIGDIFIEKAMLTAGEWEAGQYALIFSNDPFLYLPTEFIWKENKTLVCPACNGMCLYPGADICLTCYALGTIDSLPDDEWDRYADESRQLDDLLDTISFSDSIRVLKSMEQLGYDYEEDGSAGFYLYNLIAQVINGENSNGCHCT